MQRPRRHTRLIEQARVISRRRLIAASLSALALVTTAKPVTAQDWIVAEIYAAAARHGVSGDWLLRVAQCESGLNPNAVNPVTGDTGLFQFNPGTWAAWGGGNIWSVYDQCELAAWAFANGLSSHWVCQ